MGATGCVATLSESATPGSPDLAGRRTSKLAARRTLLALSDLAGPAHLAREWHAERSATSDAAGSSGIVLTSRATACAGAVD